MVHSHDSRECRYLREDDDNLGVWHCCKLRPYERNKIDLKVKEYIKDASKKGKNPYLEAVPLGDNCSGYPVLKFVEQGYDKDE